MSTQHRPYNEDGGKLLRHTCNAVLMHERKSKLSKAKQVGL